MLFAPCQFGSIVFVDVWIIFDFVTFRECDGCNNNYYEQPARKKRRIG